MYFIYILQSQATGRFYIGQTKDLLRRFREHASGENVSTRNRGPWWIPYYEIFENRITATAREKELKGWKSSKAIQALIDRHCLL